MLCMQNKTLSVLTSSIRELVRRAAGRDCPSGDSIIDILLEQLASAHYLTLNVPGASKKRSA